MMQIMMTRLNWSSGWRSCAGPGRHLGAGAHVPKPLQLTCMRRVHDHITEQQINHTSPRWRIVTSGKLAAGIWRPDMGAVELVAKGKHLYNTIGESEQRWVHVAMLTMMIWEIHRIGPCCKPSSMVSTTFMPPGWQCNAKPGPRMCIGGTTSHAQAPHPCLS